MTYSKKDVNRMKRSLGITDNEYTDTKIDPNIDQDLEALYMQDTDPVTETTEKYAAEDLERMKKSLDIDDGSVKCPHCYTKLPVNKFDECPWCFKSVPKLT